MASYVVAAACVVAKTNSETGEGYYYRHAILPAGVPQEEKDRLVAAGLVEVVVEVEAPADEEPDGEEQAEVEAPTPRRGRRS